MDIGSEEMDAMKDRARYEWYARRDGFIQGFCAAYAKNPLNQSETRQEHIFKLAYLAWDEQCKS